MIAGHEYVRLEREYRQRQLLSNGHVGEDTDTQANASAEASIKSAMQVFIKFSAEIVLDSWNDFNR